MIEQVYSLSRGNDKALRVVSKMFIICIWYSIKRRIWHFQINVYMTVIRGTLSIGLDDQEIHEYQGGTLLKIPYNTKMNVKNLGTETLELIVVKAPAPKA